MGALHILHEIGLVSKTASCTFCIVYLYHVLGRYKVLSPKQSIIDFMGIVRVIVASPFFYIFSTDHLTLMTSKAADIFFISINTAWYVFSSTRLIFLYARVSRIAMTV